MLLAVGVPLVVAYLIGALPFGYLAGRLRGVNLFEAGSGNIGATNAARVLGWRWGLGVFVLDFLKGVVPVVVAVPLAETFATAGFTVVESVELLRVGCAALAFLGHLFPVYLGFRGGKGIATGAGTILVLVPLSALVAVSMWGVVLLVTRMVSLASLAAVSVLVLVHLITTDNPFAAGRLPVTLYLLLGTGLVFVKHRANLRRLVAGTENRIGEFAMRETIVRGLHLLALGLWFGGAAFFNFGTAVPIFDSFKQVVYAGPSDRTAYETIIAADAPPERKDALASALAGSAVGPVFPRYFAMQAVCGVIAWLTALSWWKYAGIHRWRVIVITLGLVTVAAGWPISEQVTRLRLERFHPEADIASAAQAAFAQWHLLSLGLSMVTILLAGIALALGAKLPYLEMAGREAKTPEK
jgi:acyl-phosphate glycerol 3-phosphate acyltransferase